MKLDITLIQNGKEREKVYPFAIDPAECDAEVFFGSDEKLTAPINVTVTVTDRGEYIGVNAAAVVEYEKDCARCLTPVAGTLAFELERYIVGKSSASDAFDPEEIITVTDGMIDIDRDVCEEAALQMPGIVLCSEDCPGICPKCGKMLAEGDCGCSKIKEIDPRMKIFEKLLQDDN